MLSEKDYLMKHPDAIYNLVFSNFDRESCLGCPAIEVCQSSDHNQYEDCRAGFCLWLESVHIDHEHES